MTKRKTITLNSEDFPTVKAIADSISRLRKDYKLLERLRGSSDIEEPKSFKSVISFLEMLVKREKRNIPKEKEFIDNHMEVMIAMVGDHLSDMDDWEIRRTIEDTSLKKVFEKYKHNIKDKEDG